MDTLCGVHAMSEPSVSEISVRSDGSQPGEESHALVAEVMAEIGIDVTQAFPRPPTDEVVQAADIVITIRERVKTVLARDTPAGR
jgi:protein-tyrosine-phosphatase